MNKKSSYIEVTFGGGFSFNGLLEDLVPTIETIETKLMPVLDKGHKQNLEMQRIALQAQSGQVVNQTEENIMEVV